MEGNLKFTEADLKRDHHFKLDLAPEEPKVHHAPAADEPQHHTHHHHASEKAHETEERNVKTILKDAARQIIASAIILVIGFIALNWSALSEIAIYKWKEFRGTNEASPLEDLIETKTVTYTQENLKTSSSTKVQQKQIPALNLEIAPTDNRIIIPRINKNIPIIKVSSEKLIKRDWSGLEKDMQKALQSGVVHYPGTSLPGQTGNVVVTGHSSYFPWDAGRFKDVFALLHEVVEGDKIVVYFEQDKYVYEVTEVKVVLPEDIEVLKQTPDDRLTLITCTPVGTNLKRLIVTSKLVAKNNQEIAAKTER